MGEPVGLEDQEQDDRRPDRHLAQERQALVQAQRMVNGAAVERAGGTLVLADTSDAGTTFALRLRADQVRKREARPARA